MPKGLARFGKRIHASARLKEISHRRAFKNVRRIIASSSPKKLAENVNFRVDVKLRGIAPAMHGRENLERARIKKRLRSMRERRN